MVKVIYYFKKNLETDTFFSFCSICRCVHCYSEPRPYKIKPKHITSICSNSEIKIIKVPPTRKKQRISMSISKIT